MRLFLTMCILFLLKTDTFFPQSSQNTFLWLDAHANFKRLGTQEGVTRILTTAKEAGLRNVILDLRGIDGYVLYPSKIAPVLNEYEGFKRDANYDYPAVVMRTAHSLGLGIYFSLNVFAEGNKEKRMGRCYTDHADWQVQVYTAKGIVPISESNEEIAAFVNPILPEVQAYELSIIEEMTSKYKPDGIVLDRTRYPNISGDFSQASRSAFEKFIGQHITAWPEDIYKIVSRQDSSLDRVPGKYYKQWLEWRAQNIRDFFATARKRIHTIDPNCKFSDYVGAWYPVYFDVGVNWASDSYHPEKEYEWADSSYYHTGYAKLLDFLCVGNYFYEVTKEEAIAAHAGSQDQKSYWWYSVEGSAEVAVKAVDNAIPVYGSLWAHQYFEKNSPQQFVKALKAVMRTTNGAMLFDVSEIDELNWWPYIKEALVSY